MWKDFFRKLFHSPLHALRLTDALKSSKFLVVDLSSRAVTHTRKHYWNPEAQLLRAVPQDFNKFWHVDHNAYRFIALFINLLSFLLYCFLLRECGICNSSHQILLRSYPQSCACWILLRNNICFLQYFKSEMVVSCYRVFNYKKDTIKKCELFVFYVKHNVNCIKHRIGRFPL